MVVMDASSPAAAAAPGSTAAGPGHRHPGDHDPSDQSHMRGPHDPMGPNSGAANAGSPSNVPHDGLHGVHGGGGRWYQQQQQQMSGYMDEEVGAGRNSAPSPSAASHAAMNSSTNDYFPGGGQGSSISQSYGKIPIVFFYSSIAFLEKNAGCLHSGS